MQRFLYLSLIQQRVPLQVRTTLMNRCYQTSVFNKIKTLYTSGKEEAAICEYFKKLHPISASYLIARQNKNSDVAWKIYQTAENAFTFNLHSTIALIRFLEKKKEYQMINLLWDELVSNLNKITARDIVKIKSSTWGRMIMCLCRENRLRDVMKLFAIVIEYNIKLDRAVYVSLLAKCTNKEWLDLGKQIHSYLTQIDEMGIVLKSCLINMYGKCGYLEEAMRIFEKTDISERDVIVWNTIIAAYAENEKGNGALELFHRMRKEGVKPNAQTITCVLKAFCEPESIEKAIQMLFSMENEFNIKPNEYHYNSMLKSCAKNGLLELGKLIHNHLIEKKYSQNIILQTSLINMYAKCGCLEDAIQIFNSTQLRERDIAILNTMMLAYGQYGKGKEALMLFLQMQQEGMRPNEKTITCVLRTCCESNLIEQAAQILFSMQNKLNMKPNEYHYNCLLSACADNRLLPLGRSIHNHIVENNYPQSTILKTSLIDMYAKCGDLEEAQRLFNSIAIPDRNVVTWTVMIFAYGQHGKALEALHLFEQMQREGFEPNNTTITSILSACTHSGQVKEALAIFESLEKKFKMKPNLTHCNCIVDILAKDGRLDHAEYFILESMNEYGIEPDVITWKILLKACRFYMDVERAERIGTILMDLDPNDDSVYMLLCDIYTQNRHIRKLEQLKELWEEKGVNRFSKASRFEMSKGFHQYVNEEAGKQLCQ